MAAVVVQRMVKQMDIHQEWFVDINNSSHKKGPEDLAKLIAGAYRNCPEEIRPSSIVVNTASGAGLLLSCRLRECGLPIKDIPITHANRNMYQSSLLS